jgi:hypothetical protein
LCCATCGGGGLIAACNVDGRHDCGSAAEGQRRLALQGQLLDGPVSSNERRRDDRGMQGAHSGWKSSHNEQQRTRHAQRRQGQSTEQTTIWLSVARCRWRMPERRCIPYPLPASSPLCPLLPLPFAVCAALRACASLSVSPAGAASQRAGNEKLF